MKLEILDPNNELEKSFGLWLRSRIISRFLALLDSRKLQRWQSFFDTTDTLVLLYSKLDVERTLRYGIRFLRVKKLPDKVVIYLDRNQLVPGLDRVKLESFFRLITYGNSSISGYPLLITNLQHFVDNINHYVELYEEGIE